MKNEPLRLEGTSSRSSASPEFLKPFATFGLLLAANILGGTTSAPNFNTPNVTSRTGEGYIFQFPVSQRRQRSLLLLPQEQIASIRRYFSLSVADLARVFRVERPTIYSWLKGNVNPRSAHLERVRKIYSIAGEWRSMSSEPVRGMLTTSYSGNGTLLSILSQETIDEKAVRGILTKLRQALDRVPSRRSIKQIADENGLKIQTRKISLTSPDESIDL
jgi:transcriptional regulator with XRE-family HTH domain